VTLVKRQVHVLDGARKALLKRFHGRVPDKLFWHAIGQVADVAGRIARAAPKVLAEPSVKGPLKRVLLFCAASEYPHYAGGRLIGLKAGPGRPQSILVGCITKPHPQSPHEHITHLGNPKAGWTWPRERVARASKRRATRFSWSNAYAIKKSIVLRGG
jgi:hypothetical protein